MRSEYAKGPADARHTQYCGESTCQPSVSSFAISCSIKASCLRSSRARPGASPLASEPTGQIEPSVRKVVSLPLRLGHSPIPFLMVRAKSGRTDLEPAAARTRSFPQ